MIIILWVKNILRREKEIMRKTKKFFTVLLALVMVLSTVTPVEAATAKLNKKNIELVPNEASLKSFSTAYKVSGDYEYKMLDDGTIAITGYSGDDTNLTVPTMIDNKKVTIIGFFSSNKNLVEVTIPEGIKEITGCAFADCDNLVTVNISKSVNYISLEAFNWDYKLRYINVDANNKVYTSINGILFSKDKSTINCYPPGIPDTSYVIPDSVTSIDSAFTSCYNLQTITLSKNIKSIGAYTFGWCTSLTSITIPEGVKEIKNDAFCNCSSLSEVNISKSVISIGNAFSNCQSLSSINVDKGNANLASIDGILFSKDLTQLLKYPTLKIGTSYIIPDTVKTIGKRAFEVLMYCNTVTINPNVNNIADDAFLSCQLLNINVDEDNKTYCSIDGVLFNKAKTEIIRYPSGREGSTYSIPEGVVSLGDYAFYFSELTTINIPYSIESIGWWSFTFASFSNEVKIPYTVREIGCNAFWGCQDLILLCVKDTAAYDYAVSYDIQYKLYTDDTMPTLNTSSVVLYAGGDSFNLKMNHAVKNEVIWKTNNSKVVTVKNGVMTPKAKGKAVITASYAGISYSCQVTVKNPSISKSKLTLEVRESSTLEILGNSKNVKWSSSDSSIVEVDKEGCVTAISIGTATISAKVNKKTYKCRVTVNANLSDTLLDE